MSPLAEKLQRLLRLATLQPHEEGDQARENEARTAAWLLLREAQKHEVKLVFKLPDSGAPTGAPSHAGPSVWNTRDDLSDFIRFVERDVIRKNAAEREKRRKRAPKDGAVIRTHLYTDVTCYSCGQVVLRGSALFMSSTFPSRYTHERCGPEALL